MCWDMSCINKIQYNVNWQIHFVNFNHAINLCYLSIIYAIEKQNVLCTPSSRIVAKYCLIICIISSQIEQYDIMDRIAGIQDKWPSTNKENIIIINNNG